MITILLAQKIAQKVTPVANKKRSSRSHTRQKIIFYDCSFFRNKAGGILEENLIKIPFHFRYNTRAIFTSHIEIFFKSKARLIRTLTDQLHFLPRSTLFDVQVLFIKKNIFNIKKTCYSKNEAALEPPAIDHKRMNPQQKN